MDSYCRDQQRNEAGDSWRARDLKIPIRCAACGVTGDFKYHWLRTWRTFYCRACKTAVFLNLQEIKDALERQAEKARSGAQTGEAETGEVIPLDTAARPGRRRE